MKKVSTSNFNSFKGDLSFLNRFHYRRLLLLSGFFLLICCKKPSATVTSQSAKKIKSITSYTYTSQYVSIDSNKLSEKRIELFDTNGICIERIKYNPFKRDPNSISYGARINSILADTNRVAFHFWKEFKNDTITEYEQARDIDYMVFLKTDRLKLSQKKVYVKGKLIEHTVYNNDSYQYIHNKPVVVPNPLSKLYRYDATGKLVGIRTLKDHLWSTSKFSYKGNLLLGFIERDDKTNAVLYSESYAYDKKNRKVSQVEVGFSGDTKMVYNRFYSYNDKDSITLFRSLMNRKLFLKQEFIYDADGKIRNENDYDEFTKTDTTHLSVKTEYYYNNRNKLAHKAQFFYNSENPAFLSYYKYDNLNNLIELILFGHTDNTENMSTDGKFHFNRTTTRYYYKFYDRR